MRITLDATPLLGTRTGIGRYVAQLLPALPPALRRRGLDPDVRVVTWTARGGRLTDLPPGVTRVGLPAPARVLRAAWLRTGHPRIELLAGRCDVFHGTNFVSPPARSAHEVVTIHDLTYELHSATVSVDSLAYRGLVPRALDRGAHVVTPSAAVADAVRSYYGLGADRVTATPLGVDAPWFAAVPAADDWLARAGLPHEYLLFVGSLDPRKNLPRLLDAHARLRALDPATPDLVLAGPAGRERDLADRPGVHVTGWLADADLRALVAGARALVLPSVDEGFGLPALEALACGRPVAVADIPALREVTGGLAPMGDPHDTDALAGAVAAVLALPDDDVHRSARRNWARRWTWDACADRTVDAYLAAGAGRDG
ncbi:glycosyltransferase family 4 protein [Cellulomonas hominis]